MNWKSLNIGALASLVLLFGGCSLDDEAPDSNSVETRMPVNKRPGNPAATPAKTDQAPAELLAKIRSDLATRHESSPDQYTVVRAERVTFNDGSLGCPEPGYMYTQALVEGYWIVLEHDGKQFDYRASKAGAFRLCKNPRPPMRRNAEM